MEEHLMFVASYASLSQRYESLFEEILRGERAREAGRHLPLIPLRKLADHGFGALNVPPEHGGQGAGYQTSFRLLMDLATTDANLAHIWRSHLVFSEYIRLIPDPVLRETWWKRLVEGAIGGSALSSQHRDDNHETLITQDANGQLLICGHKYYTTGTLASDWTLVSATLDEPVAMSVLRRRRRAGESGLTLEHVSKAVAIVRVRQPRVQVKDDWDGFGQRMTATGSLVLEDAGVETLLEMDQHHELLLTFQEASLMALMVGIGRAALRDGAALMRDRTRIFNTSQGQPPRRDSQMLGIIGELSAQVRAAQEMVRAIGRELDQGSVPEASRSAQQASVLVPQLVLDVCTRIFDTLGASATSTSQELDRHWRNARTLATHDPAVFKKRMLGDWEVNGTAPKPYISSDLV